MAQVPNSSEELNPAESRVETKSRSHIQRTSREKKRSGVPGLRNETLNPLRKRNVGLEMEAEQILDCLGWRPFLVRVPPDHPKNIHKLKMACFFTRLEQHSPHFIYLEKCIYSPTPIHSDSCQLIKIKSPVQNPINFLATTIKQDTWCGPYHSGGPQAYWQNLICEFWSCDPGKKSPFFPQYRCNFEQSLNKQM